MLCFIVWGLFAVECIETQRFTYWLFCRTAGL